MQQSNWERYSPLTGVLFVALVVAVFSIGGSTPGVHDSAAKVQAFYSKHHDKQAALPFLLAIAIPFLLFFVSTPRLHLRRVGRTGPLANAAFAGGVLAAAGFGILASVHLALAEAADNVKTIGTAQALNVLDNNDFIPAAAGLGLMVLAAGASAVRHGGLPKWLGWVGVVLGIAVFTPAGFFAFLASGVWIVIVSILLTLARQGAPAASAPAGTP